MSQNALITDLPQHKQDGLRWLLGYLDEEQWEDAVVTGETEDIRRFIVNLRLMVEAWE
tara:strand:- start:1624 stop:1797 length:174 start_codon:yes stop_codon:yes gene_type:complete